MAVFLVNICKFQGCGLKYTTLRDLIHHIEEIHIVSDPRLLEKQELQQPSSLALSYVLRLSEGERARVKARQRTSSVSPVPSLCSYRSSTPTGSEFDDEEKRSDAENSDDSWTNQDEFTSEIILGMMGSHKQNESDKPFVCPVPGCKKRYKNINGIKYHAKHGHKKDLRVKKPFRCKCGKSYRTASALRQHSIIAHPVISTSFGRSTTAGNITRSHYSPETAVELKTLTSLQVHNHVFVTNAGHAATTTTNPVCLALPPALSSSITHLPTAAFTNKLNGSSVPNGATLITPALAGLTTTTPISAVLNGTYSSGGNNLNIGSNHGNMINCSNGGIENGSVPPGTTLITSTLPPGSKYASLPSLISSSTSCRTLPPGSLTFAMPSGGVQVAVPVSQVLSLPTSIGVQPRDGLMKNHFKNIDAFGGGMGGYLEDTLETLGALETVETFTGLETSIDDTKAD